MSVETIRDFIRAEIVNDRSMDLAPDDNLLLSGILDSLAVFRLVAYLEETYEIEIPPQDVTLDHFATLAHIDAYVLSRRG